MNASRRVVPLVVWLAVVAIATVAIVRTRFTADLSAFLPQHPTREQALLIDQVREGPASQLLLVAIEGDAQAVDEKTLAALSRTVADALRRDPRFRSVTNGQSNDAARDRALLFGHRYLLSERVVPQRFTADGLHAALTDSLDLLSSSAGLMLQPLITRDPTAELLGLVDALVGGRDLPTVDGVWVARPADAAPHALLLIETRAAGSDVDAQEAAIDAVRQAFADARRTLGAPAAAARLVVTGPPVFAVDSRATIERDAKRVSIVGAVLVTLLLWSVYRSLRTLLLGLVPMLTGALVGLAMVATVFGVVHAITLGFGVTLIGEAVDYAIYLFVQRPSDDASGTTRRHGFWSTIALGVVTSTIGFAALILSGFEGLAQVGVLSITGLVAAAAVTRWVLPPLLPAGFHVRPMDRLGAALERAVAFAPRLAWPALVVTLVAAAIAFGHRGHLWSDDIASLSPVSEAALARDGRLRSELGAPDVRDLVVVVAPDAQAALAGSERVVRALAPLVADGTLLGVEAPSRYLPSDAVQRARQDALPDDATLRSAFAQALDGLPFRRDGFEGFFADVAAEKHGPLLTRDDFAGTSLDLGLRALLSERHDPPDAHGRVATRWVALVALRSRQDVAANPAADGTTPDEAGTRARVAAAIAPLSRAAVDGTEIRAIDLGAGVKQLYAGYLAGAVHVGALGALAIVAVLALALRSPTRVARVVAPLVAAVVIVAAAHLATSGPLNLFHLVGLLLIVAVGSNYALFFDRRTRMRGSDGARADRETPEADRALLTSLLVANGTAVIGFGALATSAFPILNAIGTTVAPGALIALAFAAIAARPSERAS